MSVPSRRRAAARPRPPPPPGAALTVAAAPAPPRIGVALGFRYASLSRATKLSNFVVRGVPAGATVTVSCLKGCGKKSLEALRQARRAHLPEGARAAPAEGRHDDHGGRLQARAHVRGQGPRDPRPQGAARDHAVPARGRFRARRVLKLDELRISLRARIAECWRCGNVWEEREHAEFRGSAEAPDVAAGRTGSLLGALLALVLAAPASAGIIQVTPSVSGSGTLVGNGACVGTLANGVTTTSCAPVRRLRRGRSSPRPRPRRRGTRRTTWEGCPAVAANQCIIAVPGGTGFFAFPVRAVFTDTKGPDITATPAVAYSSVVDRTVTLTWTANEPVTAGSCARSTTRPRPRVATARRASRSPRASIRPRARRG